MPQICFDTDSSPFTPTGLATLNCVSGSSVRVALGTNSSSNPPATTAIITNPSVGVFVKFGDSTVTASATDGFYMLNGVYTFAIGTNTHVAMYTANSPTMYINTGY